MGRGPVADPGRRAGIFRTSYFMYSAPPEHLRLGRRKTRTLDRRWLNCGLRAQLMPGGGGCGGSLEWLLDEPGLEAPDCGFFICMKKATIIMNLRGRRRKGRRRAATATARRRRGRGKGEPRGWGGGVARGGGRAAAGGAGVGAHHHHEEHGVVGRRLVPRRRQPERLRLALKALRPCTHRVALEGAEQLLHAWSLRPVLANAIHEVLPHRHGARLRRAKWRAEQKCGGIRGMNESRPRNVEGRVWRKREPRVGG